MNRPTTVAALMSQPSTCFEPTDPADLPHRYVTALEFGDEAAVWGRYVEVHDDGLRLVTATEVLLLDRADVAAESGAA